MHFSRDSFFYFSSGNLEQNSQVKSLRDKGTVTVEMTVYRQIIKICMWSESNILLNYITMIWVLLIFSEVDVQRSVIQVDIILELWAEGYPVTYERCHFAGFERKTSKKLFSWSD